MGNFYQKQRHSLLALCWKAVKTLKATNSPEIKLWEFFITKTFLKIKNLVNQQTVQISLISE